MRLYLKMYETLSGKRRWLIEDSISMTDEIVARSKETSYNSKTIILKHKLMFCMFFQRPRVYTGRWQDVTNQCQCVAPPLKFRAVIGQGRSV